ncbi:MAG TPA: asparaginase [Pyrinomonadaceae bacterium]|jgi:L-asparaginase II
MPSTDIGPGPETDAPAPLVEVMRGAIVESRHRGHVVAVDVSERRIAQLGSPKTVTFLRSSAKPLQLLPVIASGAADRFGFDARELAVACASHNGEPIHTEAVASMLRKIGLDSSALKCGVHEPFSREIARALRKRGQRPNVLQNNCSGKHAAMLALALHLGAPFETYDQPEHPVQQMILSRVEQFTGLPRAEIALGIDGCGAPTFALPVDKMALIYARLVAPPDELDDATKDACRRIVYAMMEYPEMIGGGVTERLDTELMRAARGS